MVVANSRGRWLVAPMVLLSSTSCLSLSLQHAPGAWRMPTSRLAGHGRPRAWHTTARPLAVVDVGGTDGGDGGDDLVSDDLVLGVTDDLVDVDIMGDDDDEGE